MMECHYSRVNGHKLFEQLCALLGASPQCVGRIGIQIQDTGDIHITGFANYDEPKYADWALWGWDGIELPDESIQVALGAIVGHSDGHLMQRLIEQECCPHCGTVGRYTIDCHGQVYFKPAVNVACVAELERQREELAEVLRWYGDYDNWFPRTGIAGEGQRARAILKSVLGEET
jgi:hypothetical protein